MVRDPSQSAICAMNYYNTHVWCIYYRLIVWCFNSPCSRISMTLVNDSYRLLNLKNDFRWKFAYMQFISEQCILIPSKMLKLSWQIANVLSYYPRSLFCYTFTVSACTTAATSSCTGFIRLCLLKYIYIMQTNQVSAYCWRHRLRIENWQ